MSKQNTTMTCPYCEYIDQNTYSKVVIGNSTIDLNATLHYSVTVPHIITEVEINDQNPCLFVVSSTESVEASAVIPRDLVDMDDEVLEYFDQIYEHETTAIDGSIIYVDYVLIKSNIFTLELNGNGGILDRDHFINPAIESTDSGELREIAYEVGSL